MKEHILISLIQQRIFLIFKCYWKIYELHKLTLINYHKKITANSNLVYLVKKVKPHTISQIDSLGSINIIAKLFNHVKL